MSWTIITHTLGDGMGKVCNPYAVVQKICPLEEAGHLCWESNLSLQGLAVELGVCPKPPRYVPYKCTYVPYDGTFGASDQGQMLDV